MSEIIEYGSFLLRTSMNKVFVMGRLGVDPEMRYTPSQTAVTTLKVATTESWTKDGQRHEQTEWHRIIVWGRQAENCSKYLSKGRQVLVEGRLQTRAWDDKTGQKRYTTEIVANHVQFIGGNNASAGTHDGGDRQEPPVPTRFPQADAHADFAPTYGSGNADANINYEEIPFGSIKFHHRRDLLSTCPF
jgi:single-strand DNA-binding protein